MTLRIRIPNVLQLRGRLTPQNKQAVRAELTERVVAFRRPYPLQSANEDT